MLDSFTLNLLNILKDYNKNNDFTVLVLKELENKIKTKKNSLSIIESLNYLKEKDFIKIKYLDEEEICYCLLANAKIYLESENSNKIFKQKQTKMLIIQTLLTCLSAFLGAFVSVMIIHYFL